MEQDLEKDQHFLIDKKILELEVKEANLNEKDKVIEIGAGEGNLTEELVKFCNNVLAFEKDERFKEKLDKIKGAKIIIGNALDYDWREYNKIVSNIPYSLSEPVIMKAMWDRIEELVLIVGENFKEILCSEKSKIGVISNIVFDVSPIKKISKDCFNPKPRVNSWLIKLSLKKEDKTTGILKRIIFRNGKIKNSIIYSLVENGFTKKEAKEALEKMNFEKHVLEKPVAKMTGNFILRLRERLESFL